MNKPNLMHDQPPLSFFDKLFSDNPSDILFCSLNEIEPAFNETDSFLGNEFSQLQVVDPRTKLPTVQQLYDYTVRSKPALFKSANRSLLTKKEHSTCLAFLQSLKAKKQIFPHQLQCYEQTSAKRQNEKTAFLQFLLQYNNANYEKIYAPDLIFVALYQKYYKWEAQRLMEKHQDGIFQIHTGFPIPRLCGNSDMLGAVTDIETVSCSGSPRSIGSPVDFSKMRARFETYFELYMSGISEKEIVLASEHQIQFEISTESLVFLLCAGEYIDIPTEVMISVVANGEGECFIKITEPLPARNAGVHTAEVIAGRCAEVFFELEEDKVTEEIEANDFSGAYLLQTFEHFMSKHTYNAANTSTVRSCNLVKWKLNLENGEKQIPILTQLKSGYKGAQGSSETHQSLKLEYKSQFGCESSTKVSLIREWIQHRLTTSPHTSTDRHRINVSTFKTILSENLSIDDIEQEIERHYHVKIPRLLGSLGDFLSLLTKVSPGRYLLRYNPRFQDKLILYTETTDASSKSCVSLHGLLQEGPSDMAFMTLRQLTPIDDSLCNAMHDFYQVLPCAFPPWRPKQTHKLIDDRDFILKKVQAKTNIKAAKKIKLAERRKKVKRLKRTQKLKLKTQQKQEEKKDLEELEEEINQDRLLYGFKTTEMD